MLHEKEEGLEGKNLGGEGKEDISLLNSSFQRKDPGKSSVKKNKMLSVAEGRIRGRESGDSDYGG